MVVFLLRLWLLVVVAVDSSNSFCVGLNVAHYWIMVFHLSGRRVESSLLLKFGGISLYLSYMH